MKNWFVFLAVFMFVSTMYPVQQTLRIENGGETHISFPTRYIGAVRYRLTGTNGMGIQAGLFIQPGTFMVSGWHVQLDSPSILLPGLQFHLRAMNTRYHTFDRANNSILLFTGFPIPCTDSFYLDGAVGLNLRFLNMDPALQSWAFYYPPDLVQWLWLWKLGGILEWKQLPMESRLEIRNFGDHYADNSFSLSYFFIQSWMPSDTHTLSLEAGLYPTGTTGLSTDYQRFSLIVSWEVRL